MIATGTPGGVGHVRTPPVFLQPGDVLRTAIEGIGELVNPCVAAEPLRYPIVMTRWASRHPSPTRCRTSSYWPVREIVGCSAVLVRNIQ